MTCAFISCNFSSLGVSCNASSHLWRASQYLHIKAIYHYCIITTMTIISRKHSRKASHASLFKQFCHTGIFCSGFFHCKIVWFPTAINPTAYTQVTSAILNKTRKPSCRWQTRATLAKSSHGLRKSSGVVSCIARFPIDSLPMVSYYVLYSNCL